MPNVLDIKRRIRSVTNTRQITRAMKMVSAAKLRRAQERALSARPYAHMLTNVLKSLVSRAEIYDPETGEPRHPLLAERPEKTILLIVVTGDKGLAGAFNANILKTAQKFREARPDVNVDLVCIGRKARDFLRRRYPARAVTNVALEEMGEGSASEKGPLERASRVQIVGEHVGVLAKLEFSQASALAEDVIGQFTRGDIDGVYILYNEFKSVIAQRLVVEHLLPIREIGVVDVRMAEEAEEEERKRRMEAAKAAGISVRAAEPTEIDAEAAQFATLPVDYIYEQPAVEMFNQLLPRYISTGIFHALLESVAAEHAARMTAMESATNNATDMIDSLTLAMNRARQAKITKEIIEIVSGAAAL